MDWTSIIVAVIAALGSFLGVYYSNKKTAKDNAALITYRLDELEHKLDASMSEKTCLTDRTYKLEQIVAVHEEKIKVANNRIADLEGKLT